MKLINWEILILKSIAYTEFYFKQDTTIGDFKEVFMKYVYILSHIIDKSLDIVDDNRENIK